MCHLFCGERENLFFLASFLLALVTMSMPISADTVIFSCRGAQGETLFQQTPCGEGPQKQHVYEDYQTGWKPAAPLTKPAADTRRKANTPANSKKAKLTGKRPTSKQSDKAAAKQEKCFRKEQDLENVNRRLRRGYKPGTGKELRHKRRQYEAYLSKFCG
jgi:hypothetical protein